MSVRSQAFTIAGSTSVEVADAGIQSVSGENPKTLLRVDISVSAWNAAEVKGFVGQTQVDGGYDSDFRGYAAIASMTDANAIQRPGFTPNRALDIGNPYQVAVSPTATATSIRGSYIYEQAE